MNKTRRKKSPRIKIVSAHGFHLIDKSGAVRALLDLGSDGEPRFGLFDNKGRLRASLCIDDGQSALEILDMHEKVRASLGVAKNGQPALLLLDKNEKIHASLEMAEDGGPGLDFYDKEGELRATFSLFDRNELPKLFLIDKNGHRRPAFSTHDNGEPALAFYDKNGEGCIMVGPGPDKLEE